MKSFKICSGAALLLVCVILAIGGCASRGTAHRTTHPILADNDDAEPVPVGPPGGGAYIKATNREHSYSCSFVEFDERGDFLDFKQYIDAWREIRALGKIRSQNLFVVIYCHGWKNNSSSDDVVHFNRFLGRLADALPVEGQRPRVHGVYISWRGDSVPSYVDVKGDDYLSTMKSFNGQPVVEPGPDTRSNNWTLIVPEMLSYWLRKGAAEDKVSGVPLARTVFAAAQATKVYGGEGSRVFVIGHSFGALMLEKALGQASVASLMQQWPWPDDPAPFENTTDPKPDPLPFDCVLLVNSAAPSIYAKELSDFLWAHQERLRLYLDAKARKKGKGEKVPADTLSRMATRAPIIISVTSDADWATKVAHRWANVGAPIMPSLQRVYTRDIVGEQKQPHEPVEQSYFYEHTPGHNPLLLNRWIKEPAVVDNATPELDATGGLASAGSTMRSDLDENVANPCQFFTRDSTTGAVTPWEIRWPDADDDKWRTFDGKLPVRKGSYWIVSCNAKLIAGHADVWTEATMEMYASLYRLTEVMRNSRTDLETGYRKYPQWLFEDPR